MSIALFTILVTVPLAILPVTPPTTIPGRPRGEPARTPVIVALSSSLANSFRFNLKIAIPFSN
jgi:hypothetical protein